MPWCATPGRKTLALACRTLRAEFEEYASSSMESTRGNHEALPPVRFIVRRGPRKLEPASCRRLESEPESDACVLLVRVIGSSCGDALRTEELAHGRLSAEGRGISIGMAAELLILSLADGGG